MWVHVWDLAGETTYSRKWGVLCVLFFTVYCGVCCLAASVSFKGGGHGFSFLLLYAVIVHFRMVLFCCMHCTAPLCSVNRVFLAVLGGANGVRLPSVARPLYAATVLVRINGSWLTRNRELFWCEVVWLIRVLLQLSDRIYFSSFFLLSFTNPVDWAILSGCHTHSTWSTIPIRIGVVVGAKSHQE